MSSLPSMSGSEVVRAFEKQGWEAVRHRGSHIITVKEGHIAALSIPDHREVAKGTPRSLIRCASLTLDQFLSVL